MKNKSTLYFGGLPTQIEVNKLKNAFPYDDLSTGKVITYSEIEELLAVKRDQFRWRTVTSRWRKIVEHDTGVIIGPDPAGDKAFKVLNDGEKTSLASQKIKSAGRLARRSYIIASRVDVKQLSDQERAEYDHALNRSAAVLTAAKIKGRVALPTV